MASPSLQPTRPAGWVDLRRPADYPIILGDSLKNEGGKATDSFVNIRYNWQPKSGLGSRKSKLTKAGDKYELRVRPTDSDDDGGDFQYQGTSNIQSAGSNSKNATKSLVLIFDKSKSAFVLESISTSLDMNLKSSTGISSKSARELPQLPSNNGDSPRASNDNTQPTGKGKMSPPIEDEPGDSSNPFDYRHFIAEARDSLEKSTQQQRQAGDRTPLSGISTPVPPGASRFVSTTPQFRATASSSKASTATQQRKKKEETSSSRGGLGHSRTTSSTTAKAAAASVKRTATSKASLSKETISDSDSEADSETIAVSRLPAPKASRPAAVSNAQRPKPPVAKGHTRNVSANIGSSPHIIINDDDGDLEIDMGSPEPEERNRRNRVDPEMFRSHTNTPLGGHSSNFGNSNRPAQRPGDGSRLKDGALGGNSRDHPASSNKSAGRRDRDVSMKDIEAESSPSDEDGDVEEFELGSPQEKRPSSTTLLNSSRIESNRGADDDDDDDDDDAPAPTPPAPRTDRMQIDDDDEDDEDLLAAELEAALEEEDEAASANAGIGLGIGMHHQLSDESEVSEEE